MAGTLHTSSILIAAVFLTSCGMQHTAQRTDDVYYMPSDAPPPSAQQEPQPVAEPVATNQPTDDYYDSGTAEQYSGPSSSGFYDAAYNDPYYYNYGRFGFGTGLTFQTGWSMGPNGYPIQLGYGTGAYSGWYRPNFSMYGGYNNGWNQFAWYNDPYYGNYGYGGYGGGYGGYGYSSGYGNYWGPMGNCCSCYTPVIVGGYSNVIVGHRPSLGGGNGSTSTGVYGQRSSFRDPVGLSPAPEHTRNTSVYPERGHLDAGQRPTTVRPNVDGRGQQPTVVRPARRPEVVRTPSIERQAPAQRSTGSDRSGGGSSPSRDSGGGSGGRSPGTVRHR